jgi:hypothetical protein
VRSKARTWSGSPGCQSSGASTVAAGEKAAQGDPVPVDGVGQRRVPVGDHGQVAERALGHLGGQVGVRGERAARGARDDGPLQRGDEVEPGVVQRVVVG